MSSVSALDDQTSNAIRRAIAEAGAGRIGSACEIGERALQEGGDAVALNAMLGMLRCRNGEFRAALGHLRPAHQARPEDLAVSANLVAALVECGELEEALSVATPERAAADKSLRLARYRGYIAQLTGSTDVAVQAYHSILESDPNDWQSWNNLGNAQLLNGDFEGAVVSFRRSLELNDEPQITHMNLARALTKAGQLNEAELSFRATAERFPDKAQPLKELHDLMRRRGHPVEALHEVLEQAIERAPEDRDLLLAVGRQRMIADDFDGAEIALRRVLAADPRDGDGFLELAKLYEHKQPGKLGDLLAEAEALSLASPAIHIVRAYAHRRNKQYADGLAALERVPSDVEPWLTNDLRGQFYDKLGDAEAAFAAFTRMNEAQAADPSDPLGRAAHLRKTMSEHLDRVTAEWLAGWKAGSVPVDGRTPVFLVGFPRSGTTLLDTMLMGHRDVAVMEELPALDAVAQDIGGFDAIPGLSGDDIRKARSVYFETAGKSVDLDRKVLIDKNPLHLSRVPLIRRLFPEARFILALRHPADVILSCYFSNFRLTPALSNFLRLDTAAEFYDLMFRAWERSRNLMDLDVQTIVYERLVEDPEAQLRPIIAALGLEWRDDLLDHQSTAESRGVVKTASYAQVVEPLYRTSVNRWERYRPHLESVFPTLRPWAEKFGYAL
jgi:Flp pilus assembly protein TadD